MCTSIVLKQLTYKYISLDNLPEIFLFQTNKVLPLLLLLLYYGSILSLFCKLWAFTLHAFLCKNTSLLSFFGPSIIHGSGVARSRKRKTGCGPSGQSVHPPKNSGLSWDFVPAYAHRHSLYLIL